MCLCVTFHLVCILSPCCAILRELHLSSTTAAFLPSRSFSLWCQVEARAKGAGAGLCEKLLFDVPSVASSHEVEGKLCTTAMA